MSSVLGFRCLNFTGYSMIEAAERRAAETVKDFLTAFSKKISMRLNMTNFYNLSKLLTSDLKSSDPCPEAFHQPHER